MRNAAAAEVAHSLSDALPHGTIVVSDRRTSSVVVTGSPDTIERARELVAQLDRSTTLRTVTVDIKYLKARDALAALGSTLAIVPPSSAYAGDQRNDVVLSGSDDFIAQASQLLASFDRPGRQVKYDVRVTDLTPQSDSSNVGFLFGGVDVNGMQHAGSGSTVTTFVNNTISINATLNAMVTKGQASILAEPSLSTLNDIPAALLVGESYPIVYFDPRTGTQQVQFVNVGVNLHVTPTIGADGSITTDLETDYSQFLAFVGAFPVIGTRKAQSTLRVMDGETIVIAGLFSDVDSTTLTKVPFLADIPIVGEIFKNRQTGAHQGRGRLSYHAALSRRRAGAQMSRPAPREPLPQIAIVRVLTPGGPYVAGDVLSVAFTSLDVGRLRCHDGRSLAFPDERQSVPEVVSALVLWDTDPLRCGTIAHALLLRSLESENSSGWRVCVAGGKRRDGAPIPQATVVPVCPAPAPLADLDLSPRHTEAELTLRLRWSGDRVRRFVQVCDKLFTVERLGWYRHSLALRLLVPDEVCCADSAVQREAQQQLRMLREATAETLGNPLLAAFMPNFSVTPSWLESLETSEIARALGGFSRRHRTAFARSARRSAKNSRISMKPLRSSRVRNCLRRRLQSKPVSRSCCPTCPRPTI